MRRLLACLMIASLALALAARPAAAAEPANVTRNEAKSDFGKEVRFDLEATSTSPIKELKFLYALGINNEEDVLAFTEAAPEWRPNTKNVEASFTRDTSIEYLPVGVTVRYKWVLIADDGTVTETPVNSVVYLDTRFEWRERTQRGITVRWYGGDDAWGDSMIAAAVRGLDRLEQRIGGSVKNPMTITVYENTADMRGALPPNSAEWIGGQAQPSLGLIVGAIAPGDDAERDRLIPHELSHLVMAQATRNNYGGTPVWFEEGVAVVNQDIKDPDFADRVDEAAEDGELIPLRALASNFPSDPEQARLSYAQSESVIRYIEGEYGVEGVAKLVDQFKQGVTDDTAVQAALNVSLDKLDEDWRATLPDAKRQPKPVTGADTAPTNRFRDKPTTRERTGEGVVPATQAASGPLANIPTWALALGGLGLLLLLAGVVWIVRERSVANRRPY
ncbi:MAG TPA: peptidase MA family metallohydrolase [Herpetosiphonaceae bacterium]